MGLDGVVFDFDGVIVDGAWVRDAGWQGAFWWYAHHEGLRAWNEVLDGGEPRPDLFELLQAVSPEPLARAEVDRDLALLWAALGCQAPPMEGAIPLVTSLREAGVKVAVASNAQTWWVEHHLRRLGLTVDAVAIGDEPGMQPKPAPDLYLAAVARLGTSPDRTVAIDDLPDGAAAAQAAGLIAIHLCANGISTEHPPNQVRSLTELDIARLTELVADSL